MYLSQLFSKTKHIKIESLGIEELRDAEVVMKVSGNEFRGHSLSRVFFGTLLVPCDVPGKSGSTWLENPAYFSLCLVINGLS